MPIRAVLFDLGNVVCRYDGQPRLAALAAGCHRQPAVVREHIWDSGYEVECEAGRHTCAGIYQHLRRTLGLRMTYSQFRLTWSLAFEPDPSVIELVDAVRKRARVGMLSNNNPVLREAMFARFPEVMQRFDPVLFSCDLRARKPTWQAFARALERLELPADQVALVDDSPAAVEGARACGMRAVQFAGVEAARRELADLLTGVSPSRPA